MDVYMHAKNGDKIRNIRRTQTIIETNVTANVLNFLLGLHSDIYEKQSKYRINVVIALF